MSFWNLAPFLQNLGWALLDSLWQMGLMWLLYTAITVNGRRFSAMVRQRLAIIFLAFATLLFFINFSILFNSEGAANGSVINVFLTDTGFLAMLSGNDAGIDTLMAWLSAAYLVSLSFLLLRLSSQYYYSRRITRKGLVKIQPSIRLFTTELAERIGIKKKVRIALSRIIDTPLTIGFWKPIILLPFAAINNLSTRQLEAIIVHELYHIRRNDYLLNVLLAMAEIIFFFNPFTRMLANAIRKERENACDDSVLQFQYDALQYAGALLLLEQSRHGAVPRLALSASGSSKQYLLNRIKRLLGQGPACESFGFRQIGMLALAFLVACIGLINTTDTGQLDFSKREDALQNEKSNNYAVVYADPIENNKQPDIVSDIKTTPGSEKKNLASKKGITSIEMPEEELDAMATEMNLAAFYEKEGTSTNIGGFANTEKPIEFSIQEKDYNLTPQAAIAATAPYVPSNSFSFLLMEDTTVPKVYRIQESELKARESLEKTLKALEELNWAKLEKELSDGKMKTDIVKLQAELKKALEELDWKKINDELQESQDEIAFRENYFQRFEMYQKQQKDKQAQLKKLEQKILNERLQMNQESQNKVKPQKVKKIVVI